MAPNLSQQMFLALQNGDVETAESLRQIFCPLEDLRNEINPIRVLHHAVQLAGIAETGELVPLLSPISDEQATAVRQAASELLERASK